MQTDTWTFLADFERLGHKLSLSSKLVNHGCVLLWFFTSVTTSDSILFLKGASEDQLKCLLVAKVPEAEVKKLIVEQAKKLKGVHVWLLLFCVLLKID